jgi:hypothetical protein
MNSANDDPTHAIQKTARIKDKASDTFLEVIEFPISQSESGRLELPPSLVNELATFEKKLRDAGAVLPKDDAELKSLLAEVAKSDAPEEYVYEAHAGWIEDRAAFVTINGVMGKASARIIGINRANAVDDPSGRLTTSGTWKSWRSSVGELARSSSIMMLTICGALAGPLLAINKRQSFTICLYCRTRVGKSIATLMGASVIGVGRIEDLISWNITDARLEQRLAEHNDGMMPIDDLMTMTGTDRDKYLRIRGLAYKLTQGWVTARHDSYTRAQDGVHGSWRSITFTSNEKAVRDLAKAVKLERQHGEALRLIDQPAVLDGLDHIFDCQFPDISASEFQVWKRKTFAAIADACEANHGKVLTKYIKSLIAHGRDVESYIDKRIAYFLGHVCDEFDGEIARDVAEKYGLLYAAGMLAVRYELVPWEKNELLYAITKCYVAARDLLPDDGVSVRQGVRNLRGRLRSLTRISDLPKGKAAKDSPERLDGVRERLKARTRYLIKRDAFNSIFASATQKDLVIEWLIQKQRITLATPHTSVGAVDPRPKEQFKWPDGERRRSYEIIWPRSPKKKAAEK